jgi:hypothetical protein
MSGRTPGALLSRWYPGGKNPPGKETPTMATRKRPGTVIALTLLMLIQAIGGIPAGLGMVLDPINNIGMPLSMLEGSPFDDYLIPGLILMIVLGVFPLIVFFGLLLRYRWSWWLSLAVGGGLVIWIATEVALLGYLPGIGIALQIVFGGVGIAILVLTLVQPTRRYFGVRRRK